MADLADIPQRDSKDGSAQLLTLRSYLKDTVVGEEVYPDQILIDLLVEKSGVDIWRDLTGNPESILPFSYDTSSLKEPINRVRLMTSDTNEDDISFTDAEILALLDVIPLRYVVSCIGLKDSTDITLPEDSNHPLAILRTYLQDETGKEYLDSDLISLLFKSGMNPFGVVTDHMERATSLSMATTASNTGNSLASIDGITFSTPTDDSLLIQQSLDSVAKHASRSVYNKGSDYGMFQDGINLAETDWEKRWYAI